MQNEYCLYLRLCERNKLNILTIFQTNGHFDFGSTVRKVVGRWDNNTT